MLPFVIESDDIVIEASSRYKTEWTNIFVQKILL